MDTTTTAWDPVQRKSQQHADTTMRIHRIIAVIYGIVLAICLFSALFVDGDGRGAMLMVIGFLGLITGLHAWLAHGASQRNDAAKVGSVIVGVLMLFGFPIGTLVGGMLIYNASQQWPPRRGTPVMPAAPDLRSL